MSKDKNSTCCNQECNQGRDCPVRLGTHKPAEAVLQIAGPAATAEEARTRELTAYRTTVDNQAAEIEALRDMLESARTDLEILREALGVPVEPHQSLSDRMIEAAQTSAPQAALAAVPVEVPSETVTYTDGATATGPGRLPPVSPRQQRAAALIDSVEALLGGANGPTIQLRAMLAAAPAAGDQ